jgi:hypothetical protein
MDACPSSLEATPQNKEICYASLQARCAGLLPARTMSLVFVAIAHKCGAIPVVWLSHVLRE